MRLGGRGENAVRQIMVDGRFGAAGRRVVIEEFLEGEEATVLAFVDGERVLPMASSQDHKRIGDGDTGPNTGGMGAYSPAPVVSEAVMRRVHDEILVPVVRALAREGRPYRGILYAGLMITAEGPKVIEFNCRFGDPETQALIPRLRTDIVPVLLATARGDLSERAAGVGPAPVRGGGAGLGRLSGPVPDGLSDRGTRGRRKGTRRPCISRRDP